MKYPTNLTLQFDDGETAYFVDTNNNYYCIGYYYMDKSELREYADVSPISAYKDEDGDMCFDYDDDRWDVDSDIIEKYVADIVKKKYEIKNNGSDANDGELFRVVEGDNGWFEHLMELKNEANAKR